MRKWKHCFIPVVLDQCNSHPKINRIDTARLNFQSFLPCIKLASVAFFCRLHWKSMKGPAGGWNCWPTGMALHTSTGNLILDLKLLSGRFLSMEHSVVKPKGSSLCVLAQRSLTVALEKLLYSTKLPI